MGDTEAIDPRSFLDEPVAEAHQSAEGTPDASKDDVGSPSNWREMLMRTEPHEPLEKVESPWDPEAGGLTRVSRGFKKMLGWDGMPAVADVGFGFLEFIHNFNLVEEAGGGSDDDGEVDRTDDAKPQGVDPIPDQR